jgi:Methyltransferase domain
MMLPRLVSAETLDGLSESDPAAMRSRRDLQRIHRVMGTRTILRRALLTQLASHPPGRPLRVLELGAGDGTLMLGVARALGRQIGPVEITLLDRQQLVSQETQAAYADAGWHAQVAVCDVHDWAAASSNARDLTVCNLFLHHFEGAPLQALLAAIESSSTRFFACEPRRGRLALAASHLVGLIGANAVTREDAVLSVHAGFQGQELTQIWPQPASGWKLDEYSAGLFSHCFLAVRKHPADADKST